MDYDYVMIDGERVEINIAEAYKLWAEDFYRETGEHMHISSGVRTKQEQQDGYEDYLAGRTRVKWAKPSESSHCEIGPAGPRALDIRDSGSDNGVTVKGSHRWGVAVRLGKKYGFTWGGWGVPASEGWHFENHAVKIGGSGKAPSTNSEDDDMIVNIQGKGGVRNGGAYYIANGVASFLGGNVAGAPTLDFEQGSKLAARVTGDL